MMDEKKFLIKTENGIEKGWIRKKTSEKIKTQLEDGTRLEFKTEKFSNAIEGFEE